MNLLALDSLKSKICMSLKEIDDKISTYFVSKIKKWVVPTKIVLIHPNEGNRSIVLNKEDFRKLGQYVDVYHNGEIGWRNPFTNDIIPIRNSETFFIRSVLEFLYIIKPENKFKEERPKEIWDKSISEYSLKDSYHGHWVSDFLWWYVITFNKGKQFKNDFRFRSEYEDSQTEAPKTFK
jgi:hypothetical protein